MKTLTQKTLIRPLTRCAPLLGMATLATLAALGLSAKPVQAQTTINFDSLTAQSQASGNGYADLGSSYTIQGYTFATGGPSPDDVFVLDGNGQFGDGETSLYGNSNTPVTLTQQGGKAFSLTGIDLGPFAGNTPNSAMNGVETFTGTRADGTTVTDAVMTTSTQHQSFLFSNLTNLTSLSFVGDNGNGDGGRGAAQFDNVKLNGAAPVPEASTTASLGLMLCLGLGGRAVATRRKKAQV